MKLKIILFAVICIASTAKAQSDNADDKREAYYVDYHRDAIGMYHNKENCEYILGNNNKCSLMRFDKIQEKEIEACPYCIGGKQFRITTYIPKYYTQLAYGTDNDLHDITSQDQITEIQVDNYAIITIEHEPVNQSKINQIKSAHRVQNWAAFTKVAGASVSLYGTLSDSRKITAIGKSTYINASLWSYEADKKAKNEESLYITTTIFNSSNEDILVYETEKGLVWPVRPNHEITIFNTNTFCTTLRIDHGKDYQYVNVVACNYIIKNKPLISTDDFWIIRTVPEVEMYHHIITDSDIKSSVLYKVSKENFTYEIITDNEYEKLRKEYSKK